MRHHALLVSHQSNERVDVTLDVVDGHVEMFVAETSVGRWPIARFVSAPGADGFHLTTDGDSWTVEPRDRPLFEADALSRLARRSRAYLVNRYPRATRAFDAMRNGGLKRHLTRLLTVSGLAMTSFGFGIIAGRFRLDGGNVSAWIFVGLVLVGSVVVTQLLSAPTQSPQAGTDRERRDQAALDELMSTLRFLEPSSPPPVPMPTARDMPTVAVESPSVQDDEEFTEPVPVHGPIGAERAAGMETFDRPTPDPVSPEPPTAVTEVTEAVDVTEVTEVTEVADVAEATDVADVSEVAEATEMSEAADAAGATEATDATEMAEVAPEVPDIARHRVGRPSHPEPVVDRGRIRLPGGRQQFPRAGTDPTNPVFHFDVERADDLTTIHGIGPAFATLLNDLGIYSYRQLASIDDATLSTLRDLMGPFAGRIERDGWIEGAARAHQEQRERRTLSAG